MRGFAGGVLFRPGEKASAERRCRETGLVCSLRDLNSGWSVCFPEDGWLDDSRTVDALRAISAELPLLYFYHAENLGWGYRLFHRGSEQASVAVDFDLLDEMALLAFEAQHPELDPHSHQGEILIDLIVDRTRRSPEYRDALLAQFANVRPEEFRRLGADALTVARLTALLSPDWTGFETDPAAQVREFQRLLNIAEMSWRNHAQPDG